MSLRRLIVVIVLLLSAGCAAEQTVAATIEVDDASALVDEPVHVRILGLPAGRRVVVELAADDVDGVRWESSGSWIADADGRVDLRENAPVEGSYDGVDGMGLFWSMAPAAEPSTSDTYFVPPGAGEPITMRLTVRSDGRERATAELERRWRDGGTARGLSVADDGVSGVLYTPATNTQRGTAVLAVGGSEGAPPLSASALLAARGFPTLALDYFEGDGLPPTLNRVPLEYFAGAARLLQEETGATGIAVIGYSRGSEAALLLAQNEPELVEGTVLYAPNDRVRQAFPPPGIAWTLGGEAVYPRPIPVDQVVGQVLAVAGGRDEVWDSAAQADRLAAALDVADVEHRVLRYPDAGHAVGTHPYLPGGPATTRAADVAARVDGWPRVLEFLGSL